jgi:hypothetical protein
MHSFSNCHNGKCLVLRSVQAIVVVAAALLALIVTNRTPANEVTRWNQIATDASTTPNTDPLTETRIFAILHVAIHDAVNATESRYDPYLQGTSQYWAPQSRPPSPAPDTIRCSPCCQSRK